MLVALVLSCAPHPRIEVPPPKLTGLTIKLNVSPEIDSAQVLAGCRLWEKSGAACQLSRDPDAIQVLAMECQPTRIAFMAGTRWGDTYGAMHIAPPPCPWAGPEQFYVTVAHELGHWLGIAVNNQHLPRGNLMAAAANDMARGVTPTDYEALPTGPPPPLDGPLPPE